MPHTTIIVDSELKKTMSEFEKTHDVNWSAIAREAFKAYMKNGEKHSFKFHIVWGENVSGKVEAKEK